MIRLLVAHRFVAMNVELADRLKGSLNGAGLELGFVLRDNNPASAASRLRSR